MGAHATQAARRAVDRRGIRAFTGGLLGSFDGGKRFIALSSNNRFVRIDNRYSGRNTTTRSPPMTKLARVAFAVGAALATCTVSAQEWLEEITVTAQRQTKPLQDAPIASTALSASDLPS